jgi:hypothetical protein
MHEKELKKYLQENFGEGGAIDFYKNLVEKMGWTKIEEIIGPNDDCEPESWGERDDWEIHERYDNKGFKIHKLSLEEIKALNLGNYDSTIEYCEKLDKDFKRVDVPFVNEEVKYDSNFYIGKNFVAVDNSCVGGVKIAIKLS